MVARGIIPHFHIAKLGTEVGRGAAGNVSPWKTSYHTERTKRTHFNISSRIHTLYHTKKHSYHIQIAWKLSLPYLYQEDNLVRTKIQLWFQAHWASGNVFVTFSRITTKSRIKPQNLHCNCYPTHSEVVYLDHERYYSFINEIISLNMTNVSRLRRNGGPTTTYAPSQGILAE